MCSGYCCNLGVLTSLWRMKRSLLPLLSMSPFQAKAPTLEWTEVNFRVKGYMESQEAP